MNTKKVPALVMLLAGAVCCVVTFLNHYSFKQMLLALIVVLLIFLVIGYIFRIILELFHVNEVKQESTDEQVDDEGEVVDKTTEGEEDEDAASAESDEGEN